jgi:predicted amidohydrolase YtcJ
MRFTVVGATAIAAFLSAGFDAQLPAERATLIVTNGRVMVPSGAAAEAIAIGGNRIIAVGTTAEVERLRGPRTQTVDATGRSVVPGFIDSHVHLMLGGESLDQLNLRGARTADEARDRLRAFIAAHPGSSWVRGANGYGRLTRADLDAILPSRPAYIVSGDVHSLLANSAALAAAHVGKTTPDPPNGIIDRDRATQEPTGILRESAQGLITAVVPKPTRAERMRTLQAAIEEAHRAGVTSVVNIGGPADVALFDEAQRAGTLALRIYSALWVAPGGGDSGFPASVNATDADLTAFDRIRSRYKDTPFLKTGAIKIMLDGVIESRTAAMLSPYLDTPAAGTPNFTPERLNHIVSVMDRRGWQIVTHALGDRAVRMALDAYERANADNPRPARGRRHRIEHIEASDAADIPRFASLGVIASLQPAHARGMLNPNPTGGRVLSIGPTRHASGWPWKSIADAGGRVIFGSDWPVASLDPTASFYVPLTRAAQRMTMTEVLDAYTRTAAYAAFDEDRLGAIEPGKLADLVVLSTDVAANPPAAPDAVHVDTTILDGRVVFRRK